MDIPKKIIVTICLSFLVCRWCYTQTDKKVNWNLLEKVFNAIQLQEFKYKKGSLYNEVEGVTTDFEMPTGFFFSLSDSTNKSKAFILSFQPIERFKNDGIVEESTAYTYQGKKYYYRETEFIQCLYVDFESHHMSVCLGFRKVAMHDQKFIEKILDELKVESILKSCFQ